MSVWSNHFQSNLKSTLRWLIPLFILSFSTIPSSAQHELLFVNSKAGKLIKVREGDELIVLYKGYLGQREYFKQIVFEIGDSSVVLGNPYSGESDVSFTKRRHNTVKEIKYTDILAFRKRSNKAVLLKSALSLGSAIGSLLLLNRLYSTSGLGPFARIAISVSSGLALNGLINILMPDSPKYRIQDGWTIERVKLKD